MNSVKFDLCTARRQARVRLVYCVDNSWYIPYYAVQCRAVMRNRNREHQSRQHDAMQCNATQLVPMQNDRQT